MKFSKIKYHLAIISALLVRSLYAQTNVDSVMADTAQDPAVVATPPQPPIPSVAPDQSSGSEKSLLEFRFIKYKIEHSPDSVYFNILRLTNNNGKTVNGKLKFALPAGWHLITENEREVSIAPGETKTFPFRVSINRSATGGTSYVINATVLSEKPLFDTKNQYSVSKSCIVTIPKVVNWHMHPRNRTLYFNRFSDYTNLELFVKNKGNGSQYIRLELKLGDALDIIGSFNNRLETRIELKPHQDTVLIFPVRKAAMSEEDSRNLATDRNLIRIKAYSDSSLRSTSVMFKELQSFYINELGDRSSPLTVQAQILNLLTPHEPLIQFSAYGDVILPNQHLTDYYLRMPVYITYGEVGPNNTIGNALWERSRMNIGYYTDKWKILAGDRTNLGVNVLGGGGRGVAGTYEIGDNHYISAGWSSAVIGTHIFGQITHEKQIAKKIDLQSGINVVWDEFDKTSNYAVFSRVGFTPFPSHRVSVQLAASQLNHFYNDSSFVDINGNYINVNDPGSFYGFMALVSHGYRGKKWQTNFNGLYSSKFFSQHNNGRITVRGLARYTIDTKNQIITTANLYQYDPSNYYQGVVYPKRLLLSGQYRSEYANQVNKRLMFFIGPYFQHSYSRKLIFSQYFDSTDVKTWVHSPQLSIRANYKGHYSRSVNPYILPGYSFIFSRIDTLYNGWQSKIEAKYFRTRAGVNIIQKYWGVNVSYDYGPVDEVDETNYYLFNVYGRTLRIAPYYQRYFLDNKMLFSSRNIYSYSMPSNTERLNLNGRFEFFLNRFWTLYVDNNLTSYSRVSPEGQRVYSRRFFVGLGIKKIFDIPQPGLKFCDVRIVCFQDNNGNKIKDENELGLPDIVITVSRDSKKDSLASKILKTRSRFTSAEMVTDGNGQVVYYKMPEGQINIDIFPLMNLKEIHNLEGNKQIADIFRDTIIYIPFAQTFRVIGNIIINRDDYSSAGIVSPGNIRVVAIDSAGNSYPALSSYDGSYSIYVPQAGEYTVRANNVLGDNFQLQDAEYVVSFDGAKEFRIDFVFNEVKRKINISGANKPAAPPANNAPVQQQPAGQGSNPSGATIGVGQGSPRDTALAQKDTTGNAAVAVVDQSTSTETGVVYRVQIGSSRTQIAPNQYATAFKGAENIKEYIENGVYKYTAGEFSTWEFDQATDYKDKLVSLGYKDAFIAFFKGGKRIK